LSRRQTQPRRELTPVSEQIRARIRPTQDAPGFERFSALAGTPPLFAFGRTATSRSPHHKPGDYRARGRPLAIADQRQPRTTELRLLRAAAPEHVRQRSCLFTRCRGFSAALGRL